MKARWLFIVGLTTVSLTGVGLVQAPQPAPSSLAEFVPPEPLLYLEAKDFASLVHDWQNSAEKRLWLESDNYAIFSRSRLYLRLEQAQREFAAAAGFSPDMSLVESVAGAESALALYDIGNLQFVYITRMPSARALESILGQKRGNYETRNAAGLPYFVHVAPGSQRLVAFATTEEYMLLATREDLLAGALTLIAARSAPRAPANASSPTNRTSSAPLSLKDEHWFAESVHAAEQSRSQAVTPDLRLVLNMTSLVRSPYFRSYWIQRNDPMLKPFEAAVSDLYRSATQIREEREFLRSPQALSQLAAPGAASSNGALAAEVSLGELLRLVPDDAGFYRAWAAPRVDEVLDLVARKVLRPRAEANVVASVAPTVAASANGPGSEADLETRIDEAPLAPEGSEFVSGPLRALFENARLRALLQVQSSRALTDGVVVGNDSAVVLVAASDWDGDTARRNLQSAVEGLWTTSQLGVNWKERKAGADTFYQLDGLARIAMVTRGRYLVVASTGEALGPVLDRMASPALPLTGVYAAGFRHGRERENFYRMTRLMDSIGDRLYGQSADAGGRQPQFFSDNISSLSRTLRRVESMSIVVRDTGSSASQTVVYDLGR